MIKKIKIISIIIIITSVILVHFSYADTNMQKNKNGFIELSAEKISIGDTLDIDLNLSTIELDSFEIEISSNISLKDTYLDKTTKIELNNKNDNTDKIIVMNIDKTQLNLNKITLHFVISDELSIGDKIEINAKAISNQTDENTGEIKEITIIQEKKTIEIIEKAENESDDIEEKTDKKAKDVEEKQENNNQNTSKQVLTDSQSKSTQVKTTNTSNAQTVTYKGSNNNYLSNIELEGYSLNTNFNKDNSNYFVTVNSTDSLKINATPEDSTATVQIIGNDNISTGINKILISVTAQNGNVRYYRIYVTCEENNDNKNKNYTKLSQSSEIKSALSENIELHATYYLEEVYVQENDYVEAGTNILKYTNGTYLTAPYNCCITKLNLPEINGQCSNNHYIQIDSTNILSTSMKIDESNINKVSVGKEATITVSSLGKTYKGYVTHIGSTASNGKFEIKVEFENDDTIKLGMTSEISIT